MNTGYLLFTAMKTPDFDTYYSYLRKLYLLEIARVRQYHALD